MSARKLTLMERLTHCTTNARGCWLWYGRSAKSKDDYGRARQLRMGRIVYTTAHRAVYEMFVGPIPAGLMLCHKCDNPRCVNPKHMFVGDYSDNLVDSIRKGRRIFVVGEAHGQSVLTAAKVRKIRAADKSVSSETLARKFGCSGSAIKAVRQGRTWRHI